MSSFAVNDYFSQSKGSLPDILTWVNDNKILSAFLVSEITALMSSRVRGIFQGFIFLSKKLIDSAKRAEKNKL
jgi:hypothetical protein